MRSPSCQASPIVTCSFLRWEDVGQEGCGWGGDERFPFPGLGFFQRVKGGGTPQGSMAYPFPGSNLPLLMGIGSILDTTENIEKQGNGKWRQGFSAKFFFKVVLTFLNLPSNSPTAVNWFFPTAGEGGPGRGRGGAAKAALLNWSWVSESGGSPTWLVMLEHCSKMDDLGVQYHHFWNPVFAWNADSLIVWQGFWSKIFCFFQPNKRN